jgi:hypothetical protein
MRPFEKRLSLLTLSCVFLLGLVTAFPEAKPILSGRASYIDVSGPKIAYVPRTTKRVKYNGKIREIIRFTETISEGEKNCECPNCCSGYCYIIIYTDAIPTKGPVVILAIIWLKC